MSKNVKLNSTEWTEIVFEGRNKEYGAYALRKSSSKGHVLGMIAIIVAVLLVAAIPAIANFIEKVTPKEEVITQSFDTTVELQDIDEEEESLQDEIIREEVANEPPPPVKSTIQFVPPTIVDDDEVGDQDQMLTQDELARSRVQISAITHEGVDDPDAVDILELRQREQVAIVQDKKEEIFDFVEEMPQFPGGDVELMRFLNSNMRYPTVAAENGIQGRVVVKFVVRPDGSVDDVQVLQGVDRSLDEEAVRVVKQLPKWTPGRQNGVAVPVYYRVPVMFQLK